MSGKYDDVKALIDGYVHPNNSATGCEAAKAVLLSWFRAIRRKDLDAFRSIVTDDVVIEIPFSESGRTDQDSYRIYRGVDAVLGFWATAFKAEGVSHGMSETDLTISSDGSRIFFEGRGHLTMADGTEYRNRYVMRFDIVDGRVSRCKEYYNPIQSAFAFGRQIAGQFKLERL